MKCGSQWTFTTPVKSTAAKFKELDRFPSSQKFDAPGPKFKGTRFRHNFMKIQENVWRIARFRE